MIKIFKKAFVILKENPMIIQPFVLYMLVMSFTNRSLFAPVENPWVHAISILSSFLLTAAFLAGWFHVIKKGVEQSKKVYSNDEEKVKDNLNIVKHFFPGVGEYFLSITFSIVIYLTIFFLVTLLAIKAGAHLIPRPDVTMVQMKALLLASKSSEEIVKSLSNETLIRLGLWSMYLMMISTALNFIMMYFFAAIFYESKNPFVAMFRSIKFLIRNFLGSMVIFLFLISLNFLISAISLIGGANIIVGIIGLLLMFYYAGYYFLVLFLYYEEKNTNNTRDNSIREIETSD